MASGKLTEEQLEEKLELATHKAQLIADQAFVLCGGDWRLAAIALHLAAQATKFACIDDAALADRAELMAGFEALSKATDSTTARMSGGGDA